MEQISRCFLLLMLTPVLLSSCNQAIRGQALDTEAANVFDQLTRRQNQALEQRFDPTMRGPDFVGQLTAIEDIVPALDPRTLRALSTSLFVSNGTTTALLEDEYDYGDRAALVQLRVRRDAGSANWEIEGFHVQVATFEQLAANDFTLTDKPVGQYVFLALMFASPCIIVMALAKVLRTRGLRRKW